MTVFSPISLFRTFICTINFKLSVFQVNFWTQDETQEQEKSFQAVKLCF